MKSVGHLMAQSMDYSAGGVKRPAEGLGVVPTQLGLLGPYDTPLSHPGGTSDSGPSAHPHRHIGTVPHHAVLK